MEEFTQEQLNDVRAAVVLYMQNNISIKNPRYQEFEAILKKLNKTLQDKINMNAPSNIIDDLTTMLQYYIATMVDNKISASEMPINTYKKHVIGTFVEYFLLSYQ